MKKDDRVKGKEAAKRDLENTLSLYNEAVTRKVVGQLFDDYVKDDEKNYYTENEQEDYEVYDDSEYYEPEEYDEEYYEEEREVEFDGEEIDYGRQRNFNYDDVMIYSPRRRGGRKPLNKKKKKAAAEKIKSEKVVKNKQPKQKTVYQSSVGKKLKYNALSEKSAKKTYIEDYDDGFMTDEDFYESDMNGHKVLKTFVIIIFIMFLGFLAFFIYKINGLNQQIEMYQNQIDELGQENNAEALSREIERLNALNDSLTKENESLKAEKQQIDDNNDGSTEQTTENNSEYVVAAGDNLSKISKKFYGNPNNYQKIMEANNLTDGVVVPGQKLIIPEL